LLVVQFCFCLDTSLQALDLVRRRRNARHLALAVRAIELGEVAVDSALDGRHPPCEAVVREVLLAVVHRETACCCWACRPKASREPAKTALIWVAQAGLTHPWPMTIGPSAAGVTRTVPATKTHLSTGSGPILPLQEVCHMRKALTAILAIAVLSAWSFDASAATKKCKAGQEYDEAQGKCVTKRGS
jgi:hypothetical protein